jgi:hypothetical protein
MGGQQLLSSNGFSAAQYFTVTGLTSLSSLSSRGSAAGLTLAMNVTNLVASPAGVIASILLAYDDGTSEVITTDESWKGLSGVQTPTGYDAVGLDDSAWWAASPGGAYGVAPWGNTTVPKA